MITQDVSNRVKETKVVHRSIEEIARAIQGNLSLATRKFSQQHKYDEGMVALQFAQAELNLIQNKIDEVFKRYG